MLNLDQQNRSKRDGYLTVMVLKNTQIKKYGINECLKRLVEDLKDFVETGFQLPNGKTASVRVVQYRGDNLEKAKLMRRNENFSTSKNFSELSYMTTDDRVNARDIEDILPSKFEPITEASYNEDVRAAANGSDSRGLKEDSVLNQIPFFHVCTTGYMPPCVMHDLMQGKYVLLTL